MRSTSNGRYFFILLLGSVLLLTIPLIAGARSAAPAAKFGAPDTQISLSNGGQVVYAEKMDLSPPLSELARSQSPAQPAGDIQEIPSMPSPVRAPGGGMLDPVV